MNKIIQQDMEYMYQSQIELWELLRDKTVLITGAYGMLPSYMVYMLIYLNEKKHDYNIQIITIVRNCEKLKVRFGDFVDRSYFHVIQEDVCQSISYEGKIDYIIHGASPASSQYYDVNPTGVFMPNILGTYYTLELAKEKRTKGYLFFSSGEIYGQINKDIIYESDCGIIDSTDIRSCYGEGKRAGETMCKCYQHQYGIKTYMVRPCHTYGPTMNLKNDSRVFAEFVSNIVNHQNIQMKSDGTATRIFCYIADAVLGYFDVLLKGVPGEAYNVANEEGRCSIRELADMLCKLYPEEHLKVVFAQHENNYLENQHKIHPLYSTQKLRKLGWTPSFSIEDGFKRTIESFR